MNVQPRLTAVVEWPTASTIQVPTPASVEKVTLVMDCFVIPWVS